MEFSTKDVLDKRDVIFRVPIQGVENDIKWNSIQHFIDWFQHIQAVLLKINFQIMMNSYITTGDFNEPAAPDSWK